MNIYEQAERDVKNAIEINKLISDSFKRCFPEDPQDQATELEIEQIMEERENEKYKYGELDRQSL